MSVIRVELELVDGTFQTRMMRAGQTVRQFQSEVKNSTESLRNHSAGVESVIRSATRLDTVNKGFLGTMRDLAIVSGIMSIGLGKLANIQNSWIGDIVRANAELERLTLQMRSMSAATDAFKDAGNQVQWLRQQALQMPFALNTITNAFVKLRATGIEPMDGSLQALADGVAAFGGTDEQLQRAVLAVSQMSGKGVIQMEELRQQLGESMPRALELMARSMGVSMGTLIEEISTGTVEAKPALKALYDELDRTYGGRAQAMMNTFTGQLQKAKTQLQMIFTADAVSNTFFAELRKQLNDINNVLGSQMGQALAADLASGLATGVRWLREAVEWVIRFKDEIMTAGTIALAAFAGSRILSGLQSFSTGIGTMRAELRRAKLDLAGYRAEMAALQYMNATGVFGVLDGLAVRTRAAGAALRPLAAGIVALSPAIGGLAFALIELSSYLGIFDNKVKDAYESLRKYGNASREETVRIIDARLKNLREQEAALIKVLSSNPNTVLQGRLKEVRAEMAQVLGEQSSLISRATSEENRRSLSEFQLMLNDRMSSLQGAYNREQNEIWERYNAEVKVANLAGESIHEIEKKKDNDVLASRKKLFEETLKLYQDQLAWEQSLATYGTEGEQRRAEARINELQDRIAKLRDDYQTAVGLGVNKVAGADDAQDKLKKGVTNLNNIRDKIAKLGAEIRGANPDLAELQEMLDRREFGPMGTPEVQQLVNKTREAIAELEKLEKMRDGQKKADQDLKRIKEKNIEDEFDLIERRSGKTLTESERFILKIQRGLYPGMGPRSEIEKLLNGVSGGFDSAGSKANQFGEVARENAFGRQTVDRINSVNEALRTTGMIIGGLANGLSSLDISAALSLKNGFSGDKLLPGGALRGRAGSFLDLIGLAEGTDKGRGYNETLGYGALTGGDVDLINMTLDEIDRLQTAMLKNPANKWNSSAVGRYQIVQQTLRGLRDELGLSGDMKFDQQLQDSLATTLMKRRGNDPAGLRNEWEGLRRVDDGAIRSSYAGQPVNMGGPRISALPIYDPAKEAEIEAAVTRTNKVIQEAEAETLKARQIQNGNFEEDRKELLKQYRAHAIDASKGVEVADNNHKKLLDTIRDGKLGLSKDVNADEYKRLIAAAKELDALAEKTKKSNKARDEASRMGADLERQRIELVRETADAYKAVNDPLEKGTSRALDAMSRKWDEYLLKVEQGYTKDSAQYRQALVDKQNALGQQLALESGQVAAKWTKENQLGRISLMTQSQARWATMEREIATIDAALARFVGTEEEKVQAVAAAEERKAQIRAQYAQEADPLSRQFKEWSDFQENLAKQSAQWVNSLADGLTGLITGTGDLRSMISGVFKDMVNMNVKWLMGTIGNKGSEAGGAMAKLNAGLRNGGGAKKLGAPIAHTGGIIGRSSLASRIVGSHIFSGAPRFHTGGIVGRDEVPIIAKKGEGVFTPEQMAALGGFSQSTFQISAPVTVNGSAGTPAQNDDLAKKMAKEMEATMRGVVADEIRQQMKPGNLGNNRGVGR